MVGFKIKGKLHVTTTQVEEHLAEEWGNLSKDSCEGEEKTKSSEQDSI